MAEDKTNFQAILKLLDKDDVFALMKTVTGKVDKSSRPSAEEAILKATSSREEFFKRVKITRALLTEYIIKEGWKLPKGEKKELRDYITQKWDAADISKKNPSGGPSHGRKGGVKRSSDSGTPSSSKKFFVSKRGKSSDADNRHKTHDSMRGSYHSTSTRRPGDLTAATKLEEEKGGPSHGRKGGVKRSSDSGTPSSTKKFFVSKRGKSSDADNRHKTHDSMRGSYHSTSTLRPGDLTAATKLEAEKGGPSHGRKGSVKRSRDSGTPSSTKKFFVSKRGKSSDADNRHKTHDSMRGSYHSTSTLRPGDLTAATKLEAEKGGPSHGRKGSVKRSSDSGTPSSTKKFSVPKRGKSSDADNRHKTDDSTSTLGSGDMTPATMLEGYDEMESEEKEGGRRPDNTIKIFVGNLSSDTTPDKIRPLFEKYGQVVECDVLKNFGFVHMLNKNEAIEAIAQLDGYRLDGNNIRVELSTGKKGPGGDGYPRDFDRYPYPTFPPVLYDRHDTHYRYLMEREAYHQARMERMAYYAHMERGYPGGRERGYPRISAPYAGDRFL